MSVLPFTFHLLPFTSRPRRGYTLIELLIVISLTALIITIGASAYRLTADKQAIKSDLEKIMTTLASAQKKSTSGTSECTDTYGPYYGERFITNLGSRTITTYSSCTAGDSDPVTFDLSLLSFSTSNNLLFRPLNQGVDTGPSSAQNLDLTYNNTTYRIIVDRSGTLTLIGEVSP